MNKKIHTILEKIRLRWLKEYIPNISIENAHFIRNLIKNNNIKSVLEIWTAHGYSTIQIAEQLSQLRWNIDTIEFSQPSYEIAAEYINESQLSNIHQYFWDAREIIPLLEKTYDLIFIDGMKKASLDFYLLAKNKINADGIIIIDDVIKFKDKMKTLYQYLYDKQILYRVIQIDSDDGIMIISSSKSKLTLWTK